MSAASLLSAATAFGVSISLHGRQLRLVASEQPPPDLVDDIRHHRDALVQHLRKTQHGPSPKNLPARIADIGGTYWLEPRIREPIRKSCVLPSDTCPEFISKLKANGWQVRTEAQS